MKNQIFFPYRVVAIYGDSPSIIEDANNRSEAEDLVSTILSDPDGPPDRLAILRFDSNGELIDEVVYCDDGLRFTRAIEE